MFCKQCNQENWAGATVCAYCGASLIPENATPQASAPTNDPPAWDPAAGSAGYSPDSSGYTPDGSDYSPNGAGYTPDGSGYTPNDPAWDVPPAPKSNKKLWIIIPAVVVSVVLIAAVVIGFFALRTPGKLVNSFTKTGEAFMESVDSAENFVLLSRNIAEYRKTDSFAADFLLTIEDSNQVSLSYALDRSQNIFRADLGIDVDDDELDLTLGASQEKLTLSLEQLNDKLYTIPLETFGLEYNDSALEDLLSSIIDDAEEVNRILESLSLNLFAKPDLADFLKNNETLRALIESTEVEEVKEDILNTTDLTVYRTSIRLKDILAISQEYYEYSLSLTLGKEAYAQLKELAKTADMQTFLSPFAAEELSEDVSDKSLIIHFGINDDGYLSALRLCGSDDEASGFGIVLNGEKNIWDEVLLYDSDELVAGISITESDTGFVMDFFDVYKDERETVFYIACDDTTGTLTFSDGSYDVLTVFYQVEEKKATFSLDVPDEDISISLTLEEGRPVTLPQGKEESLMDFDENDYLALVLEIAGLFY